MYNNLKQSIMATEKDKQITRQSQIKLALDYYTTCGYCPSMTDLIKTTAMLEDFVIKGAPSIITSWYWKATDDEGTPSHTHDFDEVVGFFGSDTDNPSDLCGEVEFWLEDEKYILNKSCMIYCPAGLHHCPLRVVRVDKPIFFLAVSLTNKYVKDNIVRGVGKDEG